MRIIRTLLMVMGALATLAVAVVVVAVLFFSARTPTVPEKTVLTLNLNRGVDEYGGGGLTPWRGFGRQRLTLWETVAVLERAARDERVVGFVARVGAGGLGFARIQELRDAVEAFRQSGKPAYAFAESFGDFGPGNGAFYLAAAFEKIYLQPSGGVGLTGLLAESYFLKGAMEKLNVQPRIEQRAEYKGIRDSFTEEGFTAPQREAMNRILESLTGQLTAGIAADRGLSHAAVHDLMQQGPLSAQEALDGNLVDGLRYRDEVDDLVRETMGEDATFLSLAGYHRRIEENGDDPVTVALVYGVGEIHRGRSRHRSFGGAHSTGSETVAGALRRASDDEDVRAIIFRIDSAGGSYVASDTIRREVERARGRGKPVIVSMGNVAGSGGYFVAAPADRIVAQPGTLTGSIGVAAGKVVSRGFWDKLGVSWDHAAGNSNATFWSSVQDFTPAQTERLDHRLDGIYDDLVAKVAEGRKLSLEQVRAAAKGRVWTGADARERGLVDELGGYAATLRAVREAAGIAPEEAIRLRRFPRRKSTLRLLVEELTLDGGAGVTTPLAAAHAGAGAGAEGLRAVAEWARSAGLTGRRGLLEMALPYRLR